MIKNNFFIPILTIVLLTSGFGISQAFAHQDPGTCGFNSPATAVGVFRDTAPAGPGPEDVIPVSGSNSPNGAPGAVDINEQVILVVTVKKADPVLDCNYEQGTLWLRDPGLSDTLLSPSLPLIFGANTGDPGTLLFKQAYTVLESHDTNSCAPSEPAVTADNDEILWTCLFYGTHDDIANPLDVNGIGHTGPGETNSPASDFRSFPIVINADWTPETDSSVKGDQANDVVDPFDDITITGLGTVPGTFSATYELDATNGGVIDSGACDANGSIIVDPLDPNYGKAFIKCSTTSGTTVNAAHGETCFNVTIDVVSGNYHPPQKTLPGADDSANECLTVVPPNPWDFGTQSNPGNNVEITFDLGNPVTQVIDTITFSSVGTDPASFTVTQADLVQVDTNTPVGSIGAGVVCSNPTAANPPPFAVQTTCTFTDPAGLPWGKTFCWDVTATVTGNYDPSSIHHNGCPLGVGTPEVDNENGVAAEIFRTAKPTWSFETLSDPTGPQTGSVSVVTDTITISGDPATPGEWSAVATLYLDGQALPIPDGDGTIVCLQHPSGDPLPAVGNPPQQIRCTWDANDGGVVPPLSASGTYCWMVTVTDASGNYFTVEDSENACAISGENNEPIATEQFTIAGGEGCTPGYYKGNLAKFPDASNWAINHHETFMHAFDLPDANPPLIKSAYKEALHQGGHGNQGKAHELDTANSSLAFAVWAQGGQQNALARHAVAALNNALNDDVAYGMTPEAVIQLVQDNWYGSPDDLNHAKGILAGLNEAEEGCPLDNNNPNDNPVPLCQAPDELVFGVCEEDD